MPDFNSALTGQEIENTLFNSANKAPNVLIPFGDSNSVRMWTRRFIPTGNITVSAGIATMNFTGNHNMPDGTKFRIHSSPFSGYNTVHTTISAPSSTSATFIAPPGAPASETITSQFITANNLIGDSGGNDWISAMQLLTKQRFSVPYSASSPGDRTQEALARIDEVVNQAPGRAVVMLGTNNATEASSENTDAAFSDLQQICETFLKNGIAVDLCTVLPFGTGYVDVASQVKVSWMLNFNMRIREYAQITRGVFLHDIHAWVSDTTQADGRALPNTLNNDGIHITTADRDSCAWIIGQKMAENYVNWLGEPESKLVSSQADSYTFNPLSSNILENPIMIDGNANGTADNWSITSPGNSFVPTIEARTLVNDGDDFGFNQVITYTGTGDFASSFTQTANFEFGKKYKGMAVCDVAMGGVPGQFDCQLRVSFTVAGFLRRVECAAGYINTDGKYYFETPEFIMPVGATGISIILRLATISTGDPILKWGRASMVKLD